MYEWHGWVVISSDTFEGDEDAEEAVAAQVKAMLEPLNVDTWAKAEVVVRNGEYWLELSGNVNHANDMPNQIRQVLDFMATEAPGSYGLLWERDDEREHPPAQMNEFRVTRMARGQITTPKDAYFSPTVPTIEDQ